jgi:MFS family permease
MERYFGTAMAVFSLCLSGGSQIGPMIAGFLIRARGWRWLFILCAILIGLNLFLILLFFPETNYRRILYKGETAQEADKEAVQMLEGKDKAESRTVEATEPALNTLYAGSCWRDPSTSGIEVQIRADFYDGLGNSHFHSALSWYHKFFSLQFPMVSSLAGEYSSYNFLITPHLHV